MDDFIHQLEVPASFEERKKLRAMLATYVERNALLPPLSMEELTEHVHQLLETQHLDYGFSGWLMVELNNAVWRETVASIPLDRRMLLLPKCLSNAPVCTATFDELGLLCQRCQQCSINPLQDEAERLGMMSVVAEGFTSIIPLLQSDVVDTIIGVGCLDSLERAFPLLIKQAVPALAIPLNRSGCADTQVDEAYVSELISMQSGKSLTLLDYDRIKQQLNDWFSVPSLQTYLSPSLSRSSNVALEWLSGDGKRWRPFLLVASYQALTGQNVVPLPVIQAALAVECFHKASLVHDDIQDRDLERNGRITVHAAEGVPTAINVGDLLLGEGYRLLASMGKPDVFAVASQAHIDLCKGQGLELQWSVAPSVLSMQSVLAIFELKTVPAFEVALILASVCAESNDPELVGLFRRYARALGLAYQLLDDVADFDSEQPLALRPSAVIAALMELNPHSEFVTGLLQTPHLKGFLAESETSDLLQKALDRVTLLANEYRTEVFEVLKQMRNVELKRLLFRVSQRILNS